MLPNIVTVLRIALIPVFVILYYLQPAYAEEPVFSWSNFALVFLYAIASFTDYLDGYLARKMNLVSKLGIFLDPVADKLMVCTALILLVDFYPTDTYWYITIATIIIIFREILISALREWISSINKRSSIDVSFIAKIKTVVQIFAILFLLYQPSFLGVPSHIIGTVLLIIATFFTLWSGAIYLKDGLTISKKTL